MENEFVQKIEPYIASENETLRHFALDVLNNSYLGTEEMYEKALQVNDEIKHEPMTNTILPYLHNYPITDNIFKKLLYRLKESSVEDGSHHFYLPLINKADLCLFVKYKEEFLEAISTVRLKKPIDISSYSEICHATSEQLYDKIKELSSQLEKEEFHDRNNYYNGKMIVKQLAKNDPLNKEELEKNIANLKGKEVLSYIDIFHIVLVGELRMASLVPELAALFFYHDQDDLFLEEVSEALIKIGGDEVVKQLVPLIENEEIVFFIVDVIKTIKTDFAEKILLSAFEKVDDIGIKTVIADGLCDLLSKDSIPVIETFVKEGYASGILNLERSLYCNCMINRVEHPKLKDWKANIDEEENRIKKSRLNMGNARKDSTKTIAAVPSKKVGRNEPCPCESGKKFKKCCGKK